MKASKKMKRLMAALLCAAMLFSLTPGGLAAYAKEPETANPAPVAQPSSSPESAAKPEPSSSPESAEGPKGNSDEGIMPMGSEGGTTDKLDGDWAYLSKFELFDDPETLDVLDGLQDGAGPFDTSTDPGSMNYKDRQGNDENDHNGKVRSFDTVSYKLSYETAGSGEYDHVKEGWLNYEMVLPYDATQAVWQTDSMAWIGTKTANRAGLDAIEEKTSGYYLATEDRDGTSCQILRGKFWLAPNESNPYAIPGKGTLSAVVQVLAMEEGETLQPGFSGWMEHNDIDGEACAEHGRNELMRIEPPVIDITAEVRLDIQIKGVAPSGMSSVNFNLGDADAPNLGIGTRSGKVEAYSIGVYLWNGTDDGKGRKGLMAPQSGDTLSFDLTMDAVVRPQSGGADIPLANTEYAPLLWALGSDDNQMDWNGRTTLDGYYYNLNLAANTAFSTYTRGNNACYDGGIWSFTVDPSDANKVHVTLNSMDFDLTNFPNWNMGASYCYDTSGAIPISSGQLQLLQPVVKADGTYIMNDPALTGSKINSGEVWTSLTDDNMSYTYVSKTDGLEHTLTNEDQTSLTDDQVFLGFYTENTTGIFDTHVLWSSPPTGDDMDWVYNVTAPMGDTTGGKYYIDLGGDPAAPTQSIGVWFGFLHKNDIAGDGSRIVAGKSLVKFDTDAVEPTGEVDFMSSTNKAYAHNILFATKQDGSGWISDDEMEQTSMTKLKYYASLEEIPEGQLCVGILAEYWPKDDEYTGVMNDQQWLYADAALTVKPGVQQGELYQCTIEDYLWNQNAYEAVEGEIPSLAATSTLPAESLHWHEAYNKGTLDPQTGQLTGNTKGHRYGDVMQIICARSTISKEVAQIENAVSKSVYYMDSDQRFVDYKLNISTEYIETGVAVLPQGVKSTLTVLDVMPSGIEYVPNSAYYGGTYVQNATPGRQGTVTGGTPLTLLETWQSEGSTWYRFEIPDVVVGEPLAPIYLTAKIGTKGVEETDVADKQHIINTAMSRLGAEIASLDENSGTNQGSAEIVISKNDATSRSKLADEVYIENGDSFNWTINVGNNGGTILKDTVVLDVLPYVGDGKGTVISGTLSLTGWTIDADILTNFSAGNWAILYTDDTNVRATQSDQYTAADLKNGSAAGPNGVVFKNITTLPGASVDWATGVVTLPAGFNPAAMAMVGDIPGSETLKIKVQMNIEEGEQGDILANQMDGYPVPVYTVKRAIEGCTWLDVNRDGLQQATELKLPGVTATLYKLKAGGTAAKEADYEVVKDETNHEVSVETNRQVDAVTGIKTDYALGRYQFTNLPAGTYAVKFTNGTEPISEYEASPVDVGTDDTIDSDATPTYNGTTHVLEKTVILKIVMDAANNSMRDVNQVSRNNDSGFYAFTRNLTISKTVTGNMGDHERAFEFTITLKDADGNNISESYNCTVGALDGSGAANPEITQITFVNGVATLQLKHGQQVTISDLPNHCQYTVTETPAVGYTTTVAGSPGSTNMVADATVAFTNNANVVVSTGILLEIWPYALVVLLALGGAVVFLIGRKKRSDNRRDKSERW